jgi:hypothetical protein
VSYTLRGRIDSRLLAALGPVLLAVCLGLVVHGWWPLEIAALMLAAGVGLDILLYDRLLDYQPGWLALPLGLLELALTMALAYLSGVPAPLGAALAFFGASWLLAVVLGQAVFPRLRLSYADDGGELGRPGTSAIAAVGTMLLAAAGVAFVTQPPTVTLAAGVHQGPLTISRSETLVGKPGAVVRGGIVVRASGVTIRDVTVVGGVNGIDVEGVRHVVLDGVRVLGARQDGIHVRFSQVMIRDCTVSVSGEYTQGIDISYSAYQGMSAIEGCDVTGGSEGISVDSSMMMISGNRVDGTSLRAITMSEMSMGEVSQNTVSGALGVGLYCGDHSTCEISRNVVVRTRPDRSGDLARVGVGIEANYYAVAELEHNVLVGNPKPLAAFDNSSLTPQG